MKIAVLGSGGREHAIAWKLSQSKLAEKVFVIPGNGGTNNNIPIPANDFQKIKKFCLSESIDLIFVGPEDPLDKGVVNYFNNTNIKVFGPDKSAAKLESSKIWAKRFMEKYGVSTPKFWVFNKEKKENEDISLERITKQLNSQLVIKYDGLAAGKGVYVCSTKKAIGSSLNAMQKKFGVNATYLIEEKLEGAELSILAFIDGDNYKLLLPSQDYKQLLEGDKGPNTGGMGAFCPVPSYNEKLHKEIVKQIVEPTMSGIRSEKLNFKGVLYFGLIVTNDGPKVLEYNVRLGDPESEVVLPALKSDLLELTLSCFEDSLNTYKIEFNPGFYVDVVIASQGYPIKYKKGFKIRGLNSLKSDTLVFHAGTKKRNGDIFTNGGRVLNIVCKGKSFESARENVYRECDRIIFNNKYYRKDIGKRDNKILLNY